MLVLPPDGSAPAPPAGAGGAACVVPQCPAGLTILREDFLQDGFSVDRFLARWSSPSATSAASPRSLETLRDDLGVYLKVLRSSMIELINEDYADFVNLSTNLVGLDQGIQQLEEPLKKYQQQVEGVRSVLDETLATVHEKLRRREALYAKKMSLQNLELITQTLAKVERLLGLGSDAAANNKDAADADAPELSGDLVERVATEINHLNFCVSKCESSSSSSLVQELQPRLQLIGDRLHGSLERQLLDALAPAPAPAPASTRDEALRRCLRIFATVDRVGDAERLVRNKVVRPYLEAVVTERVLQDFGLAGLYSRALSILPDRLSLLLLLTVNRAPSAAAAKTAASAAPPGRLVKDFDFLSRSLWPELVEQLDDALGSVVFSAGNPDKFFAHYTASMQFLQDFECELGSLESVCRFRASAAYKTFLGRWNLPVYFQIRFQEIAMAVEKGVAAEEMFAGAGDSADAKFRLASTRKVVSALEQCWSPTVFLDALAHRFWKLTLQILSRYTLAVERAPDLPVAAVAVAAADEKEPEGKAHHSRTASDQGLSSKPAESPPAPAPTFYRSRPADMIALWLDVDRLARFVERSLFPDIVLPRLQQLADAADAAATSGAVTTSGTTATSGTVASSDADTATSGAAATSEATTTSGAETTTSVAGLTSQQRDVLTAGLGDACARLRDLQLPRLSALIVAHVSERCLPYLKQVADIPRLYRRTNRDLPAKPCSYLTALLGPVAAFKQEHDRLLQQDPSASHSWFVSIFTTVSEQYLANVTEVLAAVQKMEESLKRLKRVRDTKAGAGSGSVGPSGAANANAKVSDDDKIRLQLQLDVNAFVERMAGEFGVSAAEEVASAARLEDMVREATKEIKISSGGCS